MLKSLIALHKDTFKDSAMRATGDVLLDFLIGNPTLRDRIITAEAFATVAAAANPEGAFGKVAGPLAVQMLSIVADEVMVEFHTVCTHVDGCVAVAEKTANYEKTRELEEVFSASADSMTAQTLPADAVPATATKVDVVTRPSETIGTSLADKMSEAAQAKGTVSTTVRNSGAKSAVVCAKCGATISGNKSKAKYLYKDGAPASVEAACKEWHGKTLCGKCKQSLHQSVEVARKQIKEAEQVSRLNAQDEKEIADTKASIEKMRASIEYMAELAKDNKHVAETISKTEADIAAKERHIKEKMGHIERRSGAVPAPKAEAPTTPAPETKQAPSTTARRSGKKQTSGLNK